MCRHSRHTPMKLAAGRRQLLAVLEGQEFPWDVSASEYMSIAEQVAS